jgi:hypothetical protein
MLVRKSGPGGGMLVRIDTPAPLRVPYLRHSPEGRGVPFGFSGYAIASVLLLAIGITFWVELLFPSPEPTSSR